MTKFGRMLAAGVLAGAVGVGSGAGPALAGEGSSPLPKVRIGTLSEPTTGPEGTTEYWLDVTATDRDGVISEVVVEWTGEGHHSIAFAHRSCFLIPGVPGERVTMRIPVRLPGPGAYVARVHAHSVASCDDHSGEQTGPSKQRRFRVAG